MSHIASFMRTQCSALSLANSIFAFWNFLGFIFFLNIFNLRLVKSVDAKPVAMKSRLQSPPTDPYSELEPHIHVLNDLMHEWTNKYLKSELFVVSLDNRESRCEEAKYKKEDGKTIGLFVLWKEGMLLVLAWDLCGNWSLKPGLGSLLWEVILGSRSWGVGKSERRKSKYKNVSLSWFLLWPLGLSPGRTF